MNIERLQSWELLLVADSELARRRSFVDFEKKLVFSKCTGFEFFDASFRRVLWCVLSVICEVPIFYSKKSLDKKTTTIFFEIFYGKEGL